MRLHATVQGNHGATLQRDTKTHMGAALLFLAPVLACNFGEVETLSQGKDSDWGTKQTGPSSQRRRRVSQSNDGCQHRGSLGIMICGELSTNWDG